MNEEIEEKIFKKFNELKNLNNIVGEAVDESDFRLKEVLNLLRDSFGKNILDVGCGKGRFCRKIKDHGFDNIIGVEPSEELFKIAKERNKDINFIRASITSLPFKDSEFDFLLCVEVLEHVPNIEKAIMEMARVLKPKGKFIILDKNILSLHPVYLVPTFLWKKYLEIKNKWMYPYNFSFKEKYFVPWRLNKILKKHFYFSEFKFIHYKILRSENKKYSIIETAILKTHNIISSIFNKILPCLNLFIVWRGEK